MKTTKTDNLACRIHLLEQQIDVVKQKAEYAASDSRYEWDLLIDKMVDRLNDLLELANTTAPGLMGASEDDEMESNYSGIHSHRFQS
ncbi:hypothetical protein [Rubinisphaera italica]|uniref:Uncharacterized protein n=1 Tax=Rubinisphaera italica TaxID=2527969 RepID=A0A5C5XG38_9PLAN|nr:hypothetical protein [Rubinisphaera italica]TWT61361.1 hypothetical protein Pan54_20970 [Rubinisphaera italica]